MKILVVDDEPLHRRSLAALLRKIDPANQLLEAGDGVQALEVMASAPVDLVITDIRMPNMDGLQLLAEIRARHPAARVIILSVYSEFAYAKQAMRDGAVDYVLKPVMLKEFQAALDRVTQTIQAEKAAQRQMDGAIPAYREHLLNQLIFAADMNREELAAILPADQPGRILLADLEDGWAEEHMEELQGLLERKLEALRPVAFPVRNRPGRTACLLFDAEPPRGGAAPLSGPADAARRGKKASHCCGRAATGAVLGGPGGLR